MNKNSGGGGGGPVGSGGGGGGGAEVEIIRYQVLIPVVEVQVRLGGVKDVDSHFLWELSHMKNPSAEGGGPSHQRTEKVYHLSNSTSDFRNAFLKTIRQIIRESVRNMIVPPAGAADASPPPPDQQQQRQSSQAGAAQGPGQPRRRRQAAGGGGGTGPGQRRQRSVHYAANTAGKDGNKRKKNWLGSHCS